ncbi:phosphopantetheine-binding protein [Blastopirellula marina]|uniref:Carrier domain-containing protein n=1 Tax=Blastopirellula marina TaxID=124 RepID=A0A2S8GNT3_9BACT|nr:phosphopantetheine-binding protein [Blastopirellula marina]PQO46087.1 hypothetical protein C5Y93_10955 [Blastopirellula marina]
MTISSRTPEGEPGHCPICQAHVVIEPSILIGDAPCPQCGHLLWFFQTPEQVRFFDTEQTQTKRYRLVKRVAEQLGISPTQLLAGEIPIKDLAVDSLDVLELVMEAEEELEADQA